MSLPCWPWLLSKSALFGNRFISLRWPTLTSLKPTWDCLFPVLLLSSVVLSSEKFWLSLKLDLLRLPVLDKSLMWMFFSFMWNKLAVVLMPYRKAIDSSAMWSNWTKCSLTSSNLWGPETFARCEYLCFSETKALNVPHSNYKMLFSWSLQTLMSAWEKVAIVLLCSACLISLS